MNVAEAESPDKDASPERDIPSLFGALGLVKKLPRREYSPSFKGIVAAFDVPQNLVALV